MDNLPAATNGTQHALVQVSSVFAPLTPRDLVARAKLIEDAIGSVLKNEMHYGTIEGCGDKPTLFKPGAEKLCLMFGYRPELLIKLTELGNGHREYTIHCTLRDFNGNFAGQGIGSCSTMESKYRWRKAGRKCPKCGKEAIKVSKYDDGGFYCYAKIGGCGAKFPATDTAITGQIVGRVENEDIADQYNTCLKMAKKRALVDATLTATAASDIFTQDIEDLQDIATTAKLVDEEPLPPPAKKYSSPAEMQQQMAREAAARKKPFKGSPENTAMAEQIILEDRRHKCVAKFNEIGVRMGELEGYISLGVGGQKKIEQFTAADVDHLLDVYKRLKAVEGEEREKLIAQTFSFDDIK